MDIKKLITTDLSMPENSVYFWGYMGFLQGLTDKTKIDIISVAMSLAAKYLLTEDFDDVEDNKAIIDTITFPIIRRILQQDDLIIDYNFEKINNFVNNLIVDLIENVKTFDFTFGGFGIDAEYEFCVMYSNNFDLKKYFE